MNPFRIIVSGVIGDDGIADELEVKVNGIPEHAHAHQTATILAAVCRDIQAGEVRQFKIGEGDECPGCKRKLGTGHLVNCPWVLDGWTKASAEIAPGPNSGNN